MFAQFQTWFAQGGPVMWPILALSVAGTTLVIERLCVFAAFFRRPLPRDLDAQAELDRLQRGLGVISTIISAEPMLGILGTVTGIIQTFSSFRLSENAAPLAATAGIGEALVTTAAGLVVALALLFPYNGLLALLAKAAARLEREHEAQP